MGKTFQMTVGDTTVSYLPMTGRRSRSQMRDTVWHAVTEAFNGSHEYRLPVAGVSARFLRKHGLQARTDSGRVLVVRPQSMRGNDGSSATPRFYSTLDRPAAAINVDHVRAELEAARSAHAQAKNEAAALARQGGGAPPNLGHVLRQAGKAALQSFAALVVLAGIQALGWLFGGGSREIVALPLRFLGFFAFIGVLFGGVKAVVRALHEPYEDARHLRDAQSFAQARLLAAESELGQARRSWERLAARLGGLDPEPDAMPIRNPHDAEIAAAKWMRWMGFLDAEPMPIGPDGGIDVDSKLAVGQVKARLTPTSRPEVQQHYGVAQAEGKEPLFFALDRYTVEAFEFANQVGMALFSFDLEGRPSAVNEAARILRQGLRHEELTSEYLEWPS